MSTSDGRPDLAPGPASGRAPHGGPGLADTLDEPVRPAPGRLPGPPAAEIAAHPEGRAGQGGSESTSHALAAAAAEAPPGAGRDAAPGPAHKAISDAEEAPAYGVGTASSKLVDREAGSPTGAWRPGNDPGHRRFLEIGDMPLESGEVLPDTVLAFETWGELSPQRDNAVLVLHALTGDSHVTGEAGPGHPTPGWWDSVVGPGRAVDTQRYFVVAANILGGCQGSTGPSSTAPDGRPWGSRFPWLTTRDAVEAEARLADALGIETFHLVIGASLGGHRALEWAVSHPHRVRNLALVATGASTTADQLAWCHLQELAIVGDPYFLDGDYYSHPVGPVRGLGLARALAHTTYRSAAELDQRFGRAHQGQEDPAVGGRYQVESYLDYHAGKLLARFDANTYLIVTHSMMVHDVGTGRGGIEAALGRVTARTLVVDVDSDRLFLPAQAEELAAGVPDARRRTVRSVHGHDGFLIENDQMDAILRDFLEGSRPPAGDD